MTPHAQATFVSYDLLGSAPGWLPTYFTGAAATALRAGFAGQAIEELGGQVLEGWRVSQTPTAIDYDPRAASTPVYSLANVKPLRLQLDAEHWGSPRVEGRWCARPGDVVVKKIPPVHAAIISNAARRHPVDGSALVIRDLSRAAAVWVALCLNQPGYEQLLLVGSGVLQRVGLKALAALRVPPVPPMLDGLSARLRDSLDEQELTGETMHRVRAEAGELASAAPIATRLPRSGAFFAREAVTQDSWLPTATALRAEQADLEENLGWVSIAELAVWDDRARLASVPEDARTLRLRDVGDDLFVAPAEDAIEDSIPSRALARPLVPGDVLLSTLGRSFRTAYVDDNVPPNVFPADGWVCVRFRETPAAWALLLSTDAICSQAARLVVGSAQQFMPSEAIRSLRVPVPPREVRDRWQRAIERHHSQRRTQDRQWAALITELNALFNAAHRPFAETRPRAKEAV